jgi:hypothetical protein
MAQKRRAGQMRTLFYLPLSREITLVLCYLYPNGGNEFPALFQGLLRCPKAPMRTVQKGITLEVSAFLSPLVSSIEPQEIESELSDEEHLNVGRCLRKSPGVFIAPCLQG